MLTLILRSRPAVRETTLERGVIVRTYRELRGWTTDELAEAMGLSSPYISMIETGRRDPRDLALWERFARVLNIPWDRIAGRGGTTPPATPPPGGIDLADEEALLAACWALFYRSGAQATVPVVYGAVRRLTAAGATVSDGLTLRILGRLHQLAGVLARDNDDLNAAITHGTLALDIARQQAEPEALGSALFRLARTYHAQKDNTELALRLSREAVALAPRCRPPLRGYLYQQLADLTSATQDEPRYVIDGYLDKAKAALRGSQDDDGSFTILSESGIAHDEATVRLRVGAPLAECRLALDRTLRMLPADAIRWRTGITCTEVLTYATFGEIDSAVTLAEEVLPAAMASSSHRKRLRQALGVLRRKAANHPAVVRLGARMGTLAL